MDINMEEIMRRYKIKGYFYCLLVIVGISIFLYGCNKKSGETTNLINNDINTLESVTEDNAKNNTEEIASADNSSDRTSIDDSLTLSDFTYRFDQVAMGGGGFVSGLLGHPSEKNLFYARTDVGGAYRWNEEAGEWIPLSFGVSEADKGLLSIDGIAIDKNDPKKLYMVAGCDYYSNNKTVIFISNDYGETFITVDVTNLIKVHGNGMGRQNGERIAVDPMNGNIIYCGGRTGGLIKSIDGGLTWEKVEAFPVKSTSNQNGICSIVFDKDTKSSDNTTQRIFVSVSRSGEDNIFMSNDGGITWNAVEGLPKDLMPQRMKYDGNGNLYITYADFEGPWNSTTGGIYRYDINSNKAVDISPSDKRPMGDIAINPANPNQLVCSTMNTWWKQPNGSDGDIFYTSTDQGKTWKNILNTMTMNDNGCTWIKNYSIHWSGSLLLDSFHTNRLFVTSGNGIFTCDNIWDNQNDFYFNAKGLEETVPLDLVSIPNGALLSVIGDYSGFVHKDVKEYGTIYKRASGSNYSIAYAANKVDHWVRIVNENSIEILLTKDAGETWTALKTAPKLSDGKAKEGHVAISADASTIYWSPSNGSNTYFTKDEGATWEICKGLSSDIYLVTDPSDTNYVYANSGHIFYVSSDGGKTFKSKYFNLGGYKRFAIGLDKDRSIYIPCGEKGIAISTDLGESFIQLKNVKSCSALGLGKARNESRPYVIYMWGSVTESPENIGLFASEDNGESWIRINDDNHQFGGPGNGEFVIGDMNVYGRVYMSTVGLGIVYGEIEEK
jgi:photosystem II stability/assembly factor-like uncharacterized protein